MKNVRRDLICGWLTQNVNIVKQKCKVTECHNKTMLFIDKNTKEPVNFRFKLMTYSSRVYRAVYCANTTICFTAIGRRISGADSERYRSLGRERMGAV